MCRMHVCITSLSLVACLNHTSPTTSAELSTNLPKLCLAVRTPSCSLCLVQHFCNLNNAGSAVVQVALNPSALAADDSGHAASVQATGGNKVKLQKGAAAFKDVKVTAEEAGEYVLRIASGNRKVTVQLWQWCAF